MRNAVLLLGSGLLGSTLLVSCSSHWKLQSPLDTGCTDPMAYYYDGDGDGWGVRNSNEAQLLCVADDASGFTSVNNLDCDDEDPGISGGLGDGFGCPAGMGSLAEWVGVVHGDSEYLILHGTTNTLSGAMTSGVCNNWTTGDIATFSNDAEFAAVSEANPEDVYAGFIGVEVVGGTWAFTDGSSLNLAAYWCDSVEPETTELNVDGESVPRDEVLAIVKTSASASWCVGLASEADGYSDDNAHFVCERPKPTPVDYAPTKW